MKVLLLCAICLLACFVSASEFESENAKEYGNCTVFDRVDQFTDDRSYLLVCQHPDAFNNSLMYVLVERLPDENEHAGKYFAAIGFKILMKFHLEEEITVRYRFDKNELKTDSFVWDGDGSEAIKAMDKNDLDDLLKLVSDSDKVVFDLDGESETIELDRSDEAVKDFEKRIKGLPMFVHPEEDEDTEAEEE